MMIKFNVMMKKFSACVPAALAALLVVCVPAFAVLPIPDGQVAKEPPGGAKELPDPSMTYKVVFDVATAAPKIDQVNPMLEGITRFVNTLAQYGVPADHRMIAVVFHQGGTDAVLNNEEFKARHDGHDNPNIAIMEKLKKAGVDLRVCGQAVLARKIDPKTIQPEVQVDLWALTTIVNFQMRGYAHISGR